MPIVSSQESGKSPQPASRILIVCFGAIGDVVRALPLAVRIKRHWPQSKITWAIEPISRSILSGHPAIDQLLVFDRPRGLRAYTEFVREMRRNEFDLVLDLQRHFKSGVTSLLSGASRRVGFHRLNSREFNWLLNSESIVASEHMSLKWQQFQKFGDQLGLPALEPLAFGLEASAAENAEMSQKLQTVARAQGVETLAETNLVGLILGSTWESRFWLAERYQELIVELSLQLGLQSVLIGSASERQFANRILDNLPPGLAIDLVEQTSLRQLVPLFSQVTAAIGSDSGPMHIAAAVGTPVISLWGSTSSLRSAPYGSETLVVQANVSCAPCYKKVCPGMGMICMKNITTKMVSEKIQQVVRQQRTEKCDLNANQPAIGN